MAAPVVPESAAVEQRAVVVVGAVGPRVVVAVMCREHLPRMRTESIARIARVPAHKKLVVARLAVDNKRTVLGVEPAEIATCLDVGSQLVAAAQRQLTEQVVAEPVVTSPVVEAHFELIPRTVEEVKAVDVLLNQQRDTVGCTTTDQIRALRSFRPKGKKRRFRS